MVGSEGEGVTPDSGVGIDGGGDDDELYSLKAIFVNYSDTGYLE